VLVLPENLNQLTVPVLHKIRDLVQAGAFVLAPRPVSSPSLTGYPASEVEIRAIANEVWGAVDGKAVTEHDFRKGKVYWGRSIQEVLGEAKAVPDFEYNRPHFDTELVWLHRHAGDAEIYFVANQKQQIEDVEARFRVDGREAEFWHPDTGFIEEAEYRIENGRTIVPLHLDPYGSMFVVFRHTGSAPSRTLPHPHSSQLAVITGPWQVSFPPNWGAPARISLDKLISWTAYADGGVKYFSGTATYMKELQAPKTWFHPGAKLVVDLGNVKEIAELSVNGKPVGGFFGSLRSRLT
jgi:hypothetical protein